MTLSHLNSIHGKNICIDKLMNDYQKNDCRIRKGINRRIAIATLWLKTHTKYFKKQTPPSHIKGTPLRH